MIELAPFRFLGFDTELEFKTEQSAVFALLQRHEPPIELPDLYHASLMGWVDVHYPCTGQHKLHIRACLDPDLVQFASHENFSGEPSEATHALIFQLAREVCEYLKIESDVSWHVDLQDRSFGTMLQIPNYMM